MEHNVLDKQKLISELREIHNKLVNLYNKIFDYKFTNNNEFSDYIKEQYNQNNIKSNDQKAWNENFCHRASYTLLNKILFVRICEDKGFMRNPEDYIAGEIANLHVGEKLSKRGLQKWASVISNSTFGELIEFAFLDMKKSYNNIVLYKDNRYEILNPTDEELDLKFIEGDQDTKEFVLEFEKILSDIIEKLDTEKFDFAKTDSNILGDVYEQFMDRETRKAIGQFYTPEFVIEYILKNTVEEANVVENPFITVADISCGSGHFLIMAYDILRAKFINNLEELREKYSEETYKINKDGKERYISGREYWVKENIHYHLLKHCIYGADIDSFAIQLTTINLLLKDLDNFTDELNLIECDSLIKWEDDYNWKDLKNQLEDEFETIVTKQVNLFGEEEVRQKVIRKENYKLMYQDMSGMPVEEIINRERAQEIINICEFWNKKYDYVVGNPPYVSFGLRGNTAIDDEYYNYVITKYKNSAEYKVSIYALFIERGLEIINGKGGQLSYITPDSYLLGMYFSKVRKHILQSCSINTLLLLDFEVFEDASIGKGVISIYEKPQLTNDIVKVLKCESIEDVLYDKGITNSYPKEYFINSPKNRFYLLFDKASYMVVQKMQTYKKVFSDYCNIYSGCIGKYGKNSIVSTHKKENHLIVDKSGAIVLNDNDAIKSWRKLLGSGGRINQYSKSPIEEYIYVNEDNDIRRLYAKSGFDIEKYESEKVFIRQTGSDLIAAYDDEGYFSLNNMHIMYSTSDKLSLKVLMALLNSYLYNYYYHCISMEKGRTMPQTDIDVIKDLPVINLNNPTMVVNLIDDIMEQYKLLNNLSFKIDEVHYDNVEDVIKEYSRYFAKKSKIEAEINKIRLLIEIEIFKCCSFESDVLIEIVKDVKGYLSKELEEILLDLNKFDTGKFLATLDKYKKHAQMQIDENLLMKEVYVNENDIEEIAYKFEYEPITIISLLNQLQNEKPEKKRMLINYKYLGESIKEFYLEKIKEIFKLNKYLHLDSISKKTLKINRELINVLKKDNLSKESNIIIKEIINSDAFTWNGYRKAKKSGKVNKAFIKYYDSNYYGLAEWADEIHKQYFMDAIEEYTITKPNEKKAKDILKLFKDLDIMDKQDYIEIIESKINRAFK